MIRYTVKKKIKILLAPVCVPGYNEKDMEDIVNFVKSLGIRQTSKNPLIGIQNFLNYKTGRNPAKAKDWNEFYVFLSGLEKKTNFKLKLTFADFGIRKTIELPKPFVIDEVVSAVIKSPDRFPHSCIAVAGDRAISVPECAFIKDKKIKVRITRDKHNIYAGKVVK
jgi:uncharacterized Fe-S cluster-containing radical SAM superfamily enzyme